MIAKPGTGIPLEIQLLLLSNSQMQNSVQSFSAPAATRLPRCAGPYAFLTAGGSEGYASAAVAASVSLAVLPFLSPLLEVFLFSRGSAEKIEQTVMIKESLQVKKAV